MASGDSFITVWSRPGVFTAVTVVDGKLRRDTTTISLTGDGKAIAGGPRGALVAWIDNGKAFTALVDRDRNILNRALLAEMELRAVLVEGTSVSDWFEPLPERTAAQWPALVRTQFGLALAYTRARGEDGFGGSMRAHVLLIDEQRHRAASR